MTFLVALAFLAAPGAIGGVTQSECLRLDAPADLGLAGRSICVEVWSQGAAQRYTLVVRGQDRAQVVSVSLGLEPDEAIDPDKMEIFELKQETIVFLPVTKGEPGYRDEGFALLYRFDLRKDELHRLKERWTCRRKCSLQFLSYMTSEKKTEFYYETKVDGQHMKSSYRWEGGRMIPLVIEEPKSTDALTRGHKAPPITPVCQRTEQVRAEIQRRLKASRCESITEDDLSRVTFLEMSRKGVTKLTPGDFSGLSKLTQVELSHNPLKEIPPGLWDGLFLLRSLNMQGCKLTSIPGGVFSHLGSLKSLYLNHNRIAQLPVDAFDGLSGLTFLSLNNNRLKKLPQGWREPLNKDCHVYLSNNPMSK